MRANAAIRKGDMLPTTLLIQLEFRLISKNAIHSGFHSANNTVNIGKSDLV